MTVQRTRTSDPTWNPGSAVRRASRTASRTARPRIACREASTAGIVCVGGPSPRRAQARWVHSARRRRNSKGRPRSRSSSRSSARVQPVEGGALRTNAVASPSADHRVSGPMWWRWRRAARRAATHGGGVPPRPTRASSATRSWSGTPSRPRRHHSRCPAPPQAISTSTSDSSSAQPRRVVPISRRPGRRRPPSDRRRAPRGPRRSEAAVGRARR